MSTQPLAPHQRIFRRVDPRTWESELCPELAHILRAIIETTGARVIDLGYVNVKAPDLVAVLDRRPSTSEIAAVWAALAHTDVALTDDGIGCRRHYSEIDWTATAEPARWSRLLRAASFALRRPMSCGRCSQGKQSRLIARSRAGADTIETI